MIVHFESLSLKFRGFLGDPSGIHRGSFGDPSGIYRGSFGDPSGIPRGSFGDPSGILRGSFGDPSGILRGSFGGFSGILRGSFGGSLWRVPILLTCPLLVRISVKNITMSQVYSLFGIIRGHLGMMLNSSMCFSDQSSGNSFMMWTLLHIISLYVYVHENIYGTNKVKWYAIWIEWFLDWFGFQKYKNGRLHRCLSLQ